MLIAPELLAQLLEAADERTPITLQATAPAGAWRKMLHLRPGGGPAVLSTRAAAREWGWSARDWGRWAGEDQDEPKFPHITARPKRGPKGWDLPRAWCEAMHRKKMGLPEPVPAVQQTEIPSDVHVRRGGNYGPRSAKLAARAEESLRLSDRRGNHGGRQMKLERRAAEEAARREASAPAVDAEAGGREAKPSV